MTDDEKLALLDVSENDGWVLLEHAETSDAGIHALDIIERCQRIRANLKDHCVDCCSNNSYSVHP